MSAFIVMAALSIARPALAQTPCTPSANGYCLLAPLPLSGADSSVQNNINIATYIPAIIKLITGLAGGLAVIMIMVGGVEYVTSATGMGKTNGKDRIQNALIGLLLVIGAYTILYTINPNLVKINLNIQTLPTNTTGVPALPLPGSVSGADATGAACTNCAAMPSDIPQKPAGIGCAATSCSINASLAGKLETLTRDFGSTNWQVTEMYPPQDPNHVSSCHQDGSCVDAALTGTPSPATVASFIKDINNDVGSSFLYEACVSDGNGGCNPTASCARATQLQSATTFK